MNYLSTFTLSVFETLLPDTPPFTIATGSTFYSKPLGGELDATFAVMTVEAAAVVVGVGGLVVGGLVLGIACDSLEDSLHDGEAGAEDYGCEFARAVGIVSMRIGVSGS